MIGKMKGPQIWQEELARQIRNGFVASIKLEQRDNVYHVLGELKGADDQSTWSSYAKYSTPDKADDAIRTVKRLSIAGD